MKGIEIVKFLKKTCYVKEVMAHAKDSLTLDDSLGGGKPIATIQYLRW
jgi:hypothetical protein